MPAGATTRTVSITNIDLSLFWRNDCMSSVYNPRIKLTITPDIQGASSNAVYINDAVCPIG